MLSRMRPNQLHRQKAVNADMQGVMILWLCLNYFLEKVPTVDYLLKEWGDKGLSEKR